MSRTGRVGLVALALAAWSGTARAQSADSLVAMACAGGGSMADGLLAVEFRSDADAAGQAAMAKEAGTVFLGPSADGVTSFVAVPPGSRIDLTADRLIRLSGVQTVSEVPCPPPPAPAAAAGSDSTARADSTRPPAPGDTTRPRPPADTARRTGPPA